MIKELAVAELIAKLKQKTGSSHSTVLALSNEYFLKYPKDEVAYDILTNYLRKFELGTDKTEDVEVLNKYFS